MSRELPNRPDPVGAEFGGQFLKGVRGIPWDIMGVNELACPGGLASEPPAHCAAERSLTALSLKDFLPQARLQAQDRRPEP